MAKLIAQLLCLLVALASSHGMVLNMTELVAKLSCEIDDLSTVAVDTNNHLTKIDTDNNLQAISLPHDCCNCSATFNATVKTMMKHLNRTCQTFTAVNAFKYQLQHFLFHTHNEPLLQNLTSIVTRLQATARYLHDIAIIEGTVCVKFTPKQYMKLYECGLLYFAYNKLNTSAEVLGSLANIVQLEWSFVFNFEKLISTPHTKPIRDC